MASQFFILIWCNEGGDRGHDLFDRKLSKIEQNEFMQERYGGGGPDMPVADWINWEFGPITVEPWKPKS